MIAFSKQSKLGQVITMYLARQLNEASLDSILASFSLLDRHQSGFIDHNTLIESNLNVNQAAELIKCCRRS